MKLRKKAVNWEQIDIAIELVNGVLNHGGLLNRAEVSSDYYWSMVDEYLDYNIELVNEIIEERRKNQCKQF